MKNQLLPNYEMIFIDFILPVNRSDIFLRFRIKPFRYLTPTDVFQIIIFLIVTFTYISVFYVNSNFDFLKKFSKNISSTF